MNEILIDEQALVEVVCEIEALTVAMRVLKVSK